MEILEEIPFELDLDTLLSQLHISKDSDDATEVGDLAGAVTPLIKPKAAYQVSYIEGRGDDTVNIGGVVFTSRVLRVNLDGVERVFPYIATCGREADEAPLPSDDMMAPFWLDTIKGMALGAAGEALRDHLSRTYAVGRMSSMNPGAGPHDLWPIEQQSQLFSLLGDVEGRIGVRLTDSFLMIPNKTVSGIYFPTEITFEACKLCPREVCQGRRAPYDEALSKSYNVAST